MTIASRPVWSVNFLRIRDDALTLGAKPTAGRSFKITRGCVAVCEAIYRFSAKQLILVGLDMLRYGVTTKDHYGPAARADFDIAMKGKPHVFTPGVIREGAHDFQAEHKVVLNAAKVNNVELVWLP